MQAACGELCLGLSYLTCSSYPPRHQTQEQSVPCPCLPHQSEVIQASREARSHSSMLLSFLIIQKSALLLIRGKPTGSEVILMYFSCLRAMRITELFSREVPPLVPCPLPLPCARGADGIPSTVIGIKRLIKLRNNLPENCSFHSPVLPCPMRWAIPGELGG